MEIILKKDVENLGYANDVVTVRPGYANNYLIPQGYATVATPSAKKVLAENLRQRAHKDAKILADAQAKGTSISDVKITLTAKAGENNKIYGSVTSAQVAEALQAKGFEVDKKAITLEPIKELGSYTAIVKLHRDVKAEVPVEVVAEQE